LKSQLFVSLASVDGDALLVTKGSHWDYGREWRMIGPLNHDRTLFRIPCTPQQVSVPTV
jgi:hypothetical protein